MITIILIILGIITIWDLISISVYGWYVKDKEIYQYLKDNSNNLRVNMYDNNIFHVGNGPYIRTVPPTFTAKWHISGIGLVPRWSKTHKLINELHLKALLK